MQAPSLLLFVSILAFVPSLAFPRPALSPWKRYVVRRRSARRRGEGVAAGGPRVPEGAPPSLAITHGSSTTRTTRDDLPRVVQEEDDGRCRAFRGEEAHL